MVGDLLRTYALAHEETGFFTEIEGFKPVYFGEKPGFWPPVRTELFCLIYTAYCRLRNILYSG